MTTPRVYQLDRNAVIEIEEFNKGKITPSICLLKSIDLSGNVVSPLLSVAEGRVKQHRNEQSFLEDLQRETTALDTFFKAATTDTAELKSVAHIGQIFIDELRKTQDADIDFIKSIQATFACESPRDRAKIEYDKARALINLHNREIGDKISLACIACALGSVAARGVIKPKALADEGHAFNALADLEKISLVNFMRVTAIRMGKSADIEIFSFDDALVKYSKLVQPESAQMTSTDDEEVVHYSIPIVALLDSMRHLDGKGKLRNAIQSDLESGS